MKNSKLVDYLGIDCSDVSHKERIISAVGGFVGIAAIYFICDMVLGDDKSKFIIIASMGSTAVLLFAAPLSPLTQPWNVLGSHFIAAVIGVSCAKIFSYELVATAASVGLSIGATHYARCIHPPSGATALGAVVGGQHVHALGYEFVLIPVMFNVVIIFLVAILFNMPFSWRRYPKTLAIPISKQEE